jgi:uncharacterized membrane protein YsdA (DUF1294 family)
MLPIGPAQVWTLIIGWVFVSGLFGFVLMGIDKAKAQRKSWRIPEKTFFKLALAGGAFGVVAGSGVFHHKTLKNSFMEVIFLIAVVWIFVLFGLQSLLGPPQI